MTDENGVPRPLGGDSKRDATPALCGFDYQVWAAIDTWCQLNASEVIYFEGAEDFDRVSEEGALATQVRRKAAKISLGVGECLDAIEHFWDLAQKEPSTRTLRYAYLTTSEIATEADANFDGVSGIEAWRLAISDSAAAERLRGYLLGKLSGKSSLHAFLTAAPVHEIQERLFRRFEWLPGQPSVESVRQSVLERLNSHPEASGLAVQELGKLRNNLLAFVWEQITKPEPKQRLLSAELLAEQIRIATTVTLSVRIRLQQLPALLLSAASNFAEGGASLFAGEMPPVPTPLLERGELVESVVDVLRQGRHALLIGTVHRGKTTVAQLATIAQAPNAWWIALAGRDPAAVDAGLRATSRLIGDASCPRVVVLDNLDLNAVPLTRYEAALRVLLHRATRASKLIVATAQASLPETRYLTTWAPGFTVISIPELTADDIATHCVTFGCPPNQQAALWGRLIYSQTTGHPRLVHVRLQEMQQRAWPPITADDLLGTSPAVDAAKQLARNLYARSADEAEKTFMYRASEATIPLTREMLLSVASSASLPHPGDVIDRLIGRWIEGVPPNRYRVTPMLRSAAREVWGSVAMPLVHKHVARAIAANNTLTPSDAAAMIFHAFLGGDAALLGLAIKSLHLDDDSRVKVAVYKHLHWMNYLKPATGALLLPSDPGISFLLRHLQFDVALEEKSDQLGEIASGWKAEIEQMSNQDLRRENRSFFSLRLLSTFDAVLPLRMTLDAVKALSTASGVIAEQGLAGLRAAIAGSPLPELAGDAPVAQTWFALKATAVRSRDDFVELVRWLKDEAGPELRAAFEAVVGWPLVQNVGAFIHGAWAKEDPDRQRWPQWIEALDEAYNYALSSGSRRFGAEIAKAKSIILVEYLSDEERGLQVVADAERDFGQSAILQEQRANVFFQRSDDESVLATFAKLEQTHSTASTISDPFAYRRVAISAARLKRWKEAAGFFIRGTEVIPSAEFQLTRIGMLGDAAFAWSKADEAAEALKLFGSTTEKYLAAVARPPAREWAALRAALAAIGMEVLGRARNKVIPGFASSPNWPAMPDSMDHDLANQLLAAMGAEADARSGRVTVPQVEALVSGSSHSLIKMEHAKIQLLREVQHQPASAAFLSLANKWADAFTAHAAGHTSTTNLSAEMRWGLLIAAIMLGGKDHQARIELLQVEVAAKQDTAGLAVLAQLREGHEMTSVDGRAAIFDSNKATLVRAGACFRLLATDGRTALDTAFAQAFLLFVMGNGFMLSLFPGIARDVIGWIAKGWLPLLERGFQFSSPRTTLPALREAVNLALEGRGTLSELTTAITEATLVKFGPWPGYLEQQNWPQTAAD